MNTDKHRYKNRRHKERTYSRFLILSVSICVYLWLIFLSSCSTKPTDMRTLVPAETLVYLETNDLAAALQPIVDAKPFREVAKSKPDFSALKGVKLAVAVTGFETSEEKLTDEHSVGRVQPHFVAVADTHAWNYQAVAFAEKKLGGFVADIYDSEPALERSDKHGGKYFIWTAADGRKAYALVIDSIIYFGNDESEIDKCLTVKRGEAESIAKTGKVKPADPATLASGYVSTDGVAQIANIVGLKFATEAGEDSEVQSAIAGILPQLIRNSVTDIAWTSTKTEQRIQDRWEINMPSEVSGVLAETMAANDDIDAGLLDYIPENAVGISAYNFTDPQVAWRSVLLVTQKKADPLVARILNELSGALFEPYGVNDAEAFLRSVGPGIVSVRMDNADEKSLIISISRNRGKLPDGLDTGRFTPAIGLWPNGDRFYGTNPKDEDPFSVGVLANGKVLLGNSVSLSELTKDGRRKPPSAETLALAFRQSRPAVVSFATDSVMTLQLVSMLAREGHGETRAVSTYLTETRFTKSGMERKTTSDFGLIGAIIAQLAQE